MASEKSWGVVLRVIPFSETSVVATLLTRDFGLITALAKGARRPKSPFESALDLLSLCRVVFLRKSTDAMHLLTEAKLERRFRAAARDLNRYYAACHVVGTALETTYDGDTATAAFDAVATAVVRLDQGCDVPTTLAWFELDVLRSTGHYPSWDRCVGCNKPAPDLARMAFGHVAGGVLCRVCRVGQRNVVGISRSLRQILAMACGPNSDTLLNIEREALADRPLTATDPPKLPVETQGELRSWLNHYTAHLYGRKPRTLSWLRQGSRPSTNAIETKTDET